MEYDNGKSLEGDCWCDTIEGKVWREIVGGGNNLDGDFR